MSVYLSVTVSYEIAANGKEWVDHVSAIFKFNGIFYTGIVIYCAYSVEILIDNDDGVSYN